MLTRLHAGAVLPVEAYDREPRAKLSLGSVEAVDNQIDATTGTVRVKALFPNPDGALFPNQFVNVRLLVETVQAATLVPAAAVQRGPESAYVYVVKADQTLARKTVTGGSIDDERAVISSGVSPREVVVAPGAERPAGPGHP